MRVAMSESFLKFLKDPVGLIKRIFLKIVLLPLKYGKGGDYNAADYWRDRFQKYDMTMKGVGCEGLTEKDNWAARQHALRILRDVCRRENVRFPELRVLEIGCGNGFYTEYLRSSGVVHYTGIDITDALFAQLKKKFLDYQFVRQDITAGPINERYNLVLMMDVIQHIVQKEKLLSALRNIRDSLEAGGLFIVAPLTAVSRRHLFHVHCWSPGEINVVFGTDYVKKIIPFREGEDLVVIRHGSAISSMAG